MLSQTQLALHNSSHEYKLKMIQQYLLLIHSPDDRRVMNIK